MYRLVYVSTAIDDLGDEDVASILDVSESNNHERYITGFLAHNGRSFMQALEGEEQEVRALYETIVADPRHVGVVQIVGEKIEKRAFESWAMNYHRADDESGNMIVGRNESIEDLLPAGGPRDLLWLFANFIKIS
ncbi:MAG: BLUF domain-containing protein [Pseudomonadota bacterium]